MQCLNCGALMTSIIIQTRDNQVQYNICEKCGSLWLPKGELNKMAYQVDGNIEKCTEEQIAGAKSSYKQCPSCKYSKLEKVYFLGSNDIILDHCRTCGGFWLNSEELNLINRELKEIMPIKGKGFSEFINNAHLPLWYKRIRLQSSIAEPDDKDTPPIPGAVFKSETTRFCPVCGEKLKTYHYLGTDIDGCPYCKGIWFDKNELRKVKDKFESESWKTLRWLDNEIDSLKSTNAIISNRDCPACEKVKLLSTTFGGSGIVIDWCPECHGTWLDENEFLEIITYLKKELNELTPDEIKKIAFSKIKEIVSGPEGPVSEILDTTAAIAALVNISVFHHPKLAKLLMQFNKIARGIGV